MEYESFVTKNPEGQIVITTVGREERKFDNLIDAGRAVGGERFWAWIKGFGGSFMIPSGIGTAIAGVWIATNPRVDDVSERLGIVVGISFITFGITLATGGWYIVTDGTRETYIKNAQYKALKEVPLGLAPAGENPNPEEAQSLAIN